MNDATVIDNKTDNHNNNIINNEVDIYSYLLENDEEYKQAESNEIMLNEDLYLQYLEKIINRDYYPLHKSKKLSKAIPNNVNIDKVYFQRVKEGFKSVMEGSLGRGYMGNSPTPAGKTGTSESFYDTNNDGKVDTETYSKSFIGYAPYDNPVMSIVSISPHVSHKKGNRTYTSNVNKRIVSRICNKFFEIYK